MPSLLSSAALCAMDGTGAGGVEATKAKQARRHASRHSPCLSRDCRRHPSHGSAWIRSVICVRLPPARFAGPAGQRVAQTFECLLSVGVNRSSSHPPLPHLCIRVGYPELDALNLTVHHIVHGVAPAASHAKHLQVWTETSLFRLCRMQTYSSDSACHKSIP
jgi:hypothetical protein